jgi:hypothetical protein
MRHKLVVTRPRRSHLKINTNQSRKTYLRMTKLVAVLVCDCNAIQDLPERRDKYKYKKEP